MKPKSGSDEVIFLLPLPPPFQTCHLASAGFLAHGQGGMGRKAYNWGHDFVPVFDNPLVHIPCQSRVVCFFPLASLSILEERWVSCNAASHAYPFTSPREDRHWGSPRTRFRAASPLNISITAAVTPGGHRMPATDSRKMPVRLQGVVVSR